MVALTSDSERRQAVDAALQQTRQSAVRSAAQAMFSLNRAVRSLTGREKERVYALKARFIQRLYEQGYCVACIRETQVIDCTVCGGSGVIKRYSRYVGDCADCGGTGTYKKVKLYRFTFEIQGRAYVWHQPEDQLAFEPEPTSSQERPYEDWKPGVGDVRVEDVSKYVAVVETWLAQQEGT